MFLDRFGTRVLLVVLICNFIMWAVLLVDQVVR